MITSQDIYIYIYFDYRIQDFGQGMLWKWDNRSNISLQISVWNVDDHVFWDSFHPTEKTYRLLVRRVLDQYLRDNNKF